MESKISIVGVGILMNILSKLFGSKKTSANNIPISTNTQNNSTSLTNTMLLKVHPDIINYLWIGDGPKKNYVKQSQEHFKIKINGISISISFNEEDEPSLLYLDLPIDLNTIPSERPPYFPTYKNLTPAQRGKYWKFLSHPYDSSIDIGYVFILYYGLERFLLSDQYENVIDIIIKLRDVHTNKSFQSYSANAIILTCLYHQRADLVIKFMNSLDKEYEYNFSDNLFFLCKYCLNLSLTSREVMKFSKSFEFTKTNYIKNYPDLFEKTLSEKILEQYKVSTIPCGTLISNANFNKLPKLNIPIFSNISIRDKSIAVPQILSSFKFKKDIYDLLNATHETVKEKLSQLRKSGIEPAKTNPIHNTKTKEVLSFDKPQETLLLNEYKKYSSGSLNQHFASIALQDFYYKYRSLDSKYLLLCIKYCEDDISKLSHMQDSYYQEERKSILDYSSFLSKKEIQNRLSDIGKFTGSIPAFKRLAIIYEKEKSYTDAIEVCNQAIAYYNSINLINLKNDFETRKDKLLKKQAKIKQ